MTQTRLPLDTPILTRSHSAQATFEDMIVGESRYFSVKHLQLFRVFAGRLNKNADRDSQCVIMLDGDAICVSKIKPSVDIGVQNDSSNSG